MMLGMPPMYVTPMNTLGMLTRDARAAWLGLGLGLGLGGLGACGAPSNVGWGPTTTTPVIGVATDLTTLALGGAYGNKPGLTLAPLVGFMGMSLMIVGIAC